MSRSRVLAVALSVLVSSAVFGANERSQERVGKTRTSSSFIEWQVSVDADRLLLTVAAPDGSVHSREFAGKNTPSFRLNELGSDATDGVYKYELTVVPKISGDTKAKLKAARAANDEAAARKILREAGLAETLVQSGAFVVLNGSIVPNDLSEGTAHDAAATGSGLRTTTTDSARPPLRQGVNDQVIPDDLIVQGSLCVGFDCVNNESFGFDTIRLKENNTRIKFDDTSVSAGFPAEDWQLTANDSASGGMSKFSIEDITASRVPVTVVANAANNSIFVDSTGRVGFRTSTPVLDLHVRTNNTPAHRLEQDSTGGFTAQTWDIGGNEANFFIRDTTGGSLLSFRIRPGAPTSSLDISSQGFVGVGTGSPKKKLHAVGTPVTTFPAAALGVADMFVIENNGNSNMSIVSGTGGLGIVRFLRDGATAMNGFLTYSHAADALLFGTASTERMRIDSTGRIGIGGVTAPVHALEHSSGAHLTTGGAWINASSRELKQDIEELAAEEAVETLNGLDPVKYAYKRDPQEHHVGFIAEEVPDLVATGDRKGLSPLDIVAVLTKVVQEQQKTIEQLEKRLGELEKRD